MDIIASQRISVKLLAVAVLAVVLAVFFITFGDRAQAQESGGYTREELRRFLDDSFGKVDIYIDDLRNGYKEAKAAGEGGLTNSIGNLLQKAEEQKKLLGELRQKLNDLTEEQIDAYLKRIFVNNSVIIDSSIPSAARVFADRAEELRRGWFTKKHVAKLQYFIGVFGKVRTELNSINNKVKEFILDNLESDQPPPEPSLKPEPKPEPAPRPEPPPEPPPKPELKPPPRTAGNGWQPVRPPSEEPRPGYIWLRDGRQWRQVPNWVYEDGRLVRKDPPPGAYLYVDPQGTIRRVYQPKSYYPPSQPGQSEKPPPSSGSGETDSQTVICKRRGAWFYCDDARTGKPVVRYQAGAGRISSFIENQLQEDPKTVFLYDPDENEITGVQKQQSTPPPKSQSIQYSPGTIR